MKTEREISGMEFNQVLPPVPVELVEGWKEIPIKGIKQELVPLGAFTDFSDCDTSAVYFGERGSGPEMNFTGPVLNFVGKRINRKESLLTHFVRKDVHERLVEAQKSLPEGYFFKFYDGYRSLAVQQELYNNQRVNVKKQHPELSEDQGTDEQKSEAKKLIDEETHKYIATPAKFEDLEAREKHPAPHTTGAAIDLRLIKLSNEGMKELAALEEEKDSGILGTKVESGDLSELIEQAQKWVEQQALPKEQKDKWLAEYRYGVRKALIFRKFSEVVDMGTGFDDFSPEAEMSYYENISEQNISHENRTRRDNRRLFYKVMNDAGFLSYPGEWWHFSYGDQEWAANKRKTEALFGEVDLSELNKATEKARRLVYLKTIRDVKSGKPPILSQT